MSVIDSLKAIASYASKAKNPELLELVMRMQESVLVSRDENAKLREKVQALEKEREALKKKLLIKEKLVFEEGVYFLSGDAGKNGPYCTRCWDGDEKLIRLQVNSDGYGNCPECNTGFVYRCPPQSPINNDPNGWLGV